MWQQGRRFKLNWAHLFLKVWRYKRGSDITECDILEVKVYSHPPRSFNPYNLYLASIYIWMMMKGIWPNGNTPTWDDMQCGPHEVQAYSNDVDHWVGVASILVYLVIFKYVHIDPPAMPIILDGLWLMWCVIYIYIWFCGSSILQGQNHLSSFYSLYSALSLMICESCGPGILIILHLRRRRSRVQFGLQLTN